jgi:hypothetical protein
MNSRAKGKAGELEFTAYLKSHGFLAAARGQQRKGGVDSPDVVGVPGIHNEVKRTERFLLYDALDQARRDSAGGPNIPVVAHRTSRKRGANASPSRGDWIAVMRYDDFLVLYRAWAAMKDLEELI